MSPKPCDTRVAVVTGGSRGIGRGTALRLAQDGFAVALSYVAAKESADTTVADIVRSGGRAVAMQADVANEDAVANLFDEAEKAFGGIDVTVNAAGLATAITPVTEIDLDGLDAMYRTNVRGAFAVTQQAARRVRRGGAIINISSSMVKTHAPAFAAYIATKSAVNALTTVLAKELAGRDITVNAVAPGTTLTDMLSSTPQEYLDSLAEATPLKRNGRPEDVADIVAFLAGPARWINGQVIYANGGTAPTA